MYEEMVRALARILSDHEGAVVDHVYIVIDDCVYDLVNGGADTFTSLEEWQP